MADLPEIPDDAIRATLGWPAQAEITELTRHDVLIDGLSAAWPILYATALRHAAERAEVPGTWVSARDLRDWADEADARPRQSECVDPWHLGDDAAAHEIYQVGHAGLVMTGYACLTCGFRTLAVDNPDGLSDSESPTPTR